MEKSVILHALLSLTSLADIEQPIQNAPLPDCYGLLGCFPVDGVWAGPERPISLPPEPLHAIAPTFCLHTPAVPQCHVLDIRDFVTVHNSALDPSRPLAVITHGYLESAQLGWMEKMVTSLLRSNATDPAAGVGGVVTVDWSKAAQPPYAQAVANIRIIGAATGYLVHVLAEYYGVSVARVHLVGHSLGSHLMGYAGSYVHNRRGQKVGRITGLDPAGPYFINTATEVHLDRSDASFVDVIHTEAWQINKLGHSESMGHVDFFPNGGSEQVGCRGSVHLHIDNKKTVADGMLSYIGCSHQRSHEFFTESVNSKCNFVGRMCESWQLYQNGDCWGCQHGQCSSMGFHARPIFLQTEENSNHVIPRENEIEENSDAKSLPPSGVSSEESIRVFLGTNSEAPFCAEQYRLSVVTAVTPQSVQSGGDLARFTARLYGQQQQQCTIPAPERPAFVEPGKQVSWVGVCRPLGDLQSLQVEYEEDHGLLHALIWRFNPPTLYIDAFIVEELYTGVTTQFPFCGRAMHAGEVHDLYSDNQCAVVDQDH